MLCENCLLILPITRHTLRGTIEPLVGNGDADGFVFKGQWRWCMFIRVYVQTVWRVTPNFTGGSEDIIEKWGDVIRQKADCKGAHMLFHLLMYRNGDGACPFVLKAAYIFTLRSLSASTNQGYCQCFWLILSERKCALTNCSVILSTYNKSTHLLLLWNSKVAETEREGKSRDAEQREKGSCE